MTYIEYLEDELFLLLGQGKYALAVGVLSEIIAEYEMMGK